MSALSFGRSDADCIIATAYPVYESIKPQVESIQTGVNNLKHREIATTAELIGKASRSFEQIDAVMGLDTIEKLKDFFFQYLEYLPSSKSPYRTAADVAVHPSQWPPVSYIIQLNDSTLFPLFKQFQQMASARQDLVESLSVLQDRMGFNYKGAHSASTFVPSFIVEHVDNPFSISSVESISSEHSEQPRQAPDSITNVFLKSGWSYLETLRLDSQADKTGKELFQTMQAIRGRIRRELYKEMAAKQGIVNADAAAQWGTVNWFKPEQRQHLAEAVVAVQAKIEAGQVLAPPPK
jgi:hypothetical protein